MRVRFRGIDVREGMLLRGPAGWGEFSPFWDYGPAECAPWLAAAREAASAEWPAPRRTAVPVNCTVPAVGPEQAAAVVVASAGARTAKVKVAEPGQTEAEDIARVEAVRDTIGRTGRVRVDANGGWDVATAARMIRLLDRFTLEYVEQPCRTVEELAEVRRAVDVPIAADESIRRAEDPLRVARLEAADIAVLKVAPLGGVRACLRIAEEIGLPVVVSSALETSVGLSAGLALAAALPELPYACGLATLPLLAGDVTSHPHRVVNGMLAVRRAEPDLVGDVAPGPDTARRWHERIAAVEASA
ncbi:MAG: o-succinylbenzoate synthase [Actinomycetota bacterium]|nr:o-succinylbenzoate synthase [Actinomycetota bacterium]